MKDIMVYIVAFVLLFSVVNDRATTVDVSGDATPASEQDIPAEYRLKRNVEPGWDDPPPIPEGEEFQEMIKLLGMDGTKAEIPEAATLFTTEEIENFFGRNVAEVEEEDQYDAVFKKITYFFEADEAGNSPSVSIHAATLRADQDPDTFLYLVPAAEPLADVGVKATIHSFFGLNITILTEKDEIITIQALNLNQQQELVIEFAKLVYQRLSEK